MYNCIVVLLGWNSPAVWIASFLFSWLHRSFTLLFWRGRWHTLVSVSWVVPATAPDKLHVARKWRLLALIERISFSVAWRAHLYSVSATHDQRVQMKLSCSSATTDVVWTEHREKDELCISKAAKWPCLYLIYFALSLMLFISSLLFSFPLAVISITHFINIMSRCHSSVPTVGINLMVSSHDVCLRFLIS